MRRPPTHFFWECDACGFDQEFEGEHAEDWPGIVTCEKCGAAHEVDYDYDPEIGPSIDTHPIWT